MTVLELLNKKLARKMVRIRDWGDGELRDIPVDRVEYVKWSDGYNFVLIYRNHPADVEHTFPFQADDDFEII